MKYGAGGKGYNERGGREKNKEEKLVSKSAEKINMIDEIQIIKRKGKSIGRGTRVLSVQKGTLNAWKKEIDEVKTLHYS